MSNWFILAIVVMVWAYAIGVLGADITTGNLLPNGTNNASNYQSVDNTIPRVNTNGFNTTGNIQDWGQELEITGTGGINVTGSLVNITTGEDTTTQDKLNNGVTLNSTTIVQNCEYQGSNWQCGQAKPGQDTYTTTVSILDENGNVLSTVNQVRNNDAGYNNNAYKYLDTVTYTGTGSNQFYWAWEGVDLGYSTYNTTLGGPNLLGAKLTMTYDNVVIQPEVIEEIEEIIEEFIEWEEQFVEPVMEQMITFIPLPLLEEIEELEELALEEPQAIEILEEAFEELEEEFEEIEILQVFGVPEIVEEPEEEEIQVQEEEIVAIEEEVMEEEVAEPTEEVATEEMVETEEEVVAQEEEVIAQEEPTVVAEETPEVKEESVEVGTKEFSVDVADVETKVAETVASVSKQLQIVSVIAAKALTQTQADISTYVNQNANLFDTRQLYQGSTYEDTRTLDEYAVDIYTQQNNTFASMSNNDPVLQYQQKMNAARQKTLQLQRELDFLRRQHAR